MDERERHSSGMKVRRAVLGDAHVDRAEAAKDIIQRAVSGPDHSLRVGRDLVAPRLVPAHA